MIENKITLTETELNQLIDESVSEILKEYGVDYDKKNKKVSFNPHHQENVNTNDPWTPKPIINQINGFKVISIFERKYTEDKKDGNPLIYALKGKFGWKLNNPTYDYMALLRRFVSVCKELKEQYDVIICTPSNNSLNNEILKRVIRLVPHDVHFERFFCKYSAIDVFETTVESSKFKSCFNGQQKKYENAINDFENAVDIMNIENDGIFSYKYLPLYLRKIVSRSMHVNKDVLNDEKIFELINDKKILVIDDTVSSGKTISDSAEALMSMFSPQSITFLTLFSPISK